MSQSNDSNSSVTGDLLKEVADTLKNSTTTVKIRFKEMLVERAIASRVEQLDKGILKVQEAEKELRKVKPDQISIAPDGTKNETFSKDAWDKKQKAEETLKKLRDAVEKALNGEGFDKLAEQLK